MALVVAPTVKGVTPVRSVLPTLILVVASVSPVPVKLRRMRGPRSVLSAVQLISTLPIPRTPPARLVRLTLCLLGARSQNVPQIVQWTRILPIPRTPPARLVRLALRLLGVRPPNVLQIVQWVRILPILRTLHARLVRLAILLLVVRPLLVAWIVLWGITTMQVMMHATRARQVKSLRGGL